MNLAASLRCTCHVFHLCFLPQIDGSHYRRPLSSSDSPCQSVWSHSHHQRCTRRFQRVEKVVCCGKGTQSVAKPSLCQPSCLRCSLPVGMRDPCRSRICRCFCDRRPGLFAFLGSREAQGWPISGRRSSQQFSPTTPTSPGAWYQYSRVQAGAWAGSRRS